MTSLEIKIKERELYQLERIADALENILAVIEKTNNQQQFESEDDEQIF